MLPRGMARTGHSMRIRQMTSRPAGCARTFATGRRATGANPTSYVTLSQLSGRRAGLVAATPSSRSSPFANMPSSAAAFSLSSLNPMSWWSSSKKETPAPETVADAAATSTTTPSTTATTPPPVDAATATTQTTAVTPDASAASTITDALPTADAAQASVSEILDGSALLDMPEQIGYLHAMGLDFGWGPSSMCMWLLEHVHIYMGLPWWAAIAGTAVLFRAAIFFPSLIAAEHSAKLQQLRRDPKFAGAMKEMQDLAMRGGANKQTRLLELRQTTKRMQTAAGISTWRMFVPMLNVPFGYGMFRVLRSMAMLPVPGLENSGILWFTDLTVPDPYFILPVSSAAIMYFIFRSNIRYMSPEQAQTMKLMQIVITPVSILVTVKMSAGLTVFFFASSILQMIQTWLWHQPWLRQWSGLPPLQQLLHKPTAPVVPSISHRLSPGSSWQAPRAVSTATPASAAAEEDAMPSTVDVVKKSWGKVMNTAKGKQGEAKSKATFKKAEDYEKKRALEEDEALYRRREAERQYRELRKRMGKQ